MRQQTGLFGEPGKGSAVSLLGTAVSAQRRGKLLLGLLRSSMCVLVSLPALPSGPERKGLKAPHSDNGFVSLPLLFCQIFAFYIWGYAVRSTQIWGCHFCPPLGCPVRGVLGYLLTHICSYGGIWCKLCLLYVTPPGSIWWREPTACFARWEADNLYQT